MTNDYKKKIAILHDFMQNSNLFSYIVLFF